MAIYMNGWNYFGQCGVRNFEQIVYNPTKVIGFEGNSPISVSPGSFHTVFLTSEGRVYTCGRGAYHQLGISPDFDRCTHTVTFSAVFSQIFAVGAQAGNLHTTILSRDGEAYSCGLNLYGAPGVAEIAEIQKDSSLSMKSDVIMYGISQHIRSSQKVPGIPGRIKNYSCGRDHTMFVNDEGEVYSCGHGKSGRLGIEGDDSFGIVQRVIIPHRIKEVMCGGVHSLLLTENGEVLSCGYGYPGCLGHGESMLEDVHIPRVIESLTKYRITEMAAGEVHSLFLTSDGEVYSCGSGSHGSLGHGNRERVRTPKKIEYFQLRDKRVIHIAAGSDHSIFLCDDGRVYSCGDGKYGQLGQPSWATRDEPTEIETLRDKHIISINSKGFASGYVGSEDA